MGEGSNDDQASHLNFVSHETMVNFFPLFIAHACMVCFTGYIQFLKLSCDLFCHFPGRTVDDGWTFKFPVTTTEKKKE